MATNKIATQIRIDENIYEALKEIALIEKRSVNNLIEYFLQLQIDAYNLEMGKK